MKSLLTFSLCLLGLLSCSVGCGGPEVAPDEGKAPEAITPPASDPPVPPPG